MTETEIQSLKAKAEAVRAVPDDDDEAFLVALEAFHDVAEPDAILRLLALVEQFRNERHALEADIFGVLHSALDYPDDATASDMARMLVASYAALVEQGPTILDRAIAAVKAVRGDHPHNGFYALGVDASLLALSTLRDIDHEPQP